MRDKADTKLRGSGTAARRCSKTLRFGLILTTDVMVADSPKDAGNGGHGAGDMGEMGGTGMGM